MNVTTLGNSSVQTPANQLARLNGAHGYRFEGDTVHLNAMFALLHPDAHDQSWALQLWACPSAPASAHEITGHKVAEVALPPMGELADESECFAVNAFAWPPAGSGEYTMVLVLASGRAGHFDEIHDLAVYPRRQEFTQPRMTGNIAYRIDGARVQISVERVENPRPADNLSGTLALELWALPEPFAGGRFEGRHQAGVEIGTLSGQGERHLGPIDLDFTLPPAGAWHVALLLREWTAQGFITRDFTNFAARHISAPVAEAKPAPVVEKAPLAAVEKKVVLLAAPAVAPVVEKKAAPPVALAPAPVLEKKVAPIAAASAPVPVAEKKAALAAAPTPARATAPIEAPAKGVSVNTARVEELAAVKGLSPKMAEGIVKKRPFSSLEELRRVKGIGEAVFAKIRSSLRL